MEGGIKTGSLCLPDRRARAAPADDHCARETAHVLAARSKEKMRAQMQLAADPDPSVSSRLQRCATPAAPYHPAPPILAVRYSDTVWDLNDAVVRLSAVLYFKSHLLKKYLLFIA
jgi:hypothetical protein